MTKRQEDLKKEGELLRELGDLLSDGYQLYGQYLKNKKKFCIALDIKTNNQKVSDLIFKSGHVLPLAQRHDLLQIFRHIQSWREQWDELFDVMSPGFNDEFSFETRVKFPIESLERLDLYYYSKFQKRFPKP